MTPIYAFGPFRLDVQAEILFRGADPVALGRRAVVLLRVLLERPGAPVSKDTLIESAWPGLAIEESNLSVQIAALRRVFSAEPGREHWIETLPRRGYRFVGPVATEQISDAPAAPRSENRPGDKPSIAVLPFDNLGGDPEQAYFADGMVEEIITGLAKTGWLFVVGRNSSFIYKGKVVDVKRIGRDLGVRYVLEGSVRKSGGRVRITGQLVDTATGAHLWADRFDGSLEDVFDLQDKVTATVVGAIEPAMRNAEIQHARRKRPESLNAYDLYLRALPHAWANSYLEATRAIELLDAALKIDPDYAAAHGLAAWCHGQRMRRDSSAPARAVEHASRVVASTTDDAMALAFAAFAFALAAKFDAALAAASRAMEINPNSATVLIRSALVNALGGNTDAAIAQAKRSIQLSTLDPQRYSSEIALSIAFFNSGQFTEAAQAAQRAIKYNPAYDICHCLLAASYVRLDRLQDARQVVAHVLEIEPTRRLSNLRYMSQALRAALREAGLPE